jgi:hypothetical protein
VKDRESAHKWRISAADERHTSNKLRYCGSGEGRGIVALEANVGKPSRGCPYDGLLKNPSEPPTKTEKAIRMQKQELRNRIEHDPQLKKDFELLIAKTRLQPNQLLTGLWLDCNLMTADRQTLLSKERAEIWPICEDTLGRNIKNIRRAAGQIEAIDETEFSPALTKNIISSSCQSRSEE